MRGKELVLLGLLIGSLFFSLTTWASLDKLVFILDASNSMNKPFGDESRLEAAKGALVELLGVLPEGINVGLFVYGHRIGKEDRTASCQDIEPLFPIAPYAGPARDEMIASLYEVRAQGLTPLADAVVAAVNELSLIEGEGALVLVSDGEETCGGDPLVVAQMLGTMTPPIVLHVIGLDVEPQARETLTAMAEVTGGEYRDVSEAGELFAALFAVISPAEVPPAEEIPTEYACLGITNVIYGTQGDDTLYGTTGNDLIYGFGGNDFIMGLDGNDILVGGEGNDILEGAGGYDGLLGGPGNDLLFGGFGDDVLCGGPGNDSLEGEAGNDKLCGGAGDDQLLGGPGKDQLYRVDGCDILLEGEVVEGPSPTCRSRNLTCSLAPAFPPTLACPPPPLSPPCPAPVGMKSVDEGGSIQLHGTVFDSDCNVVEICWQAEAGRFDDPTSLDPVYYAPLTEACEGEDVRITLTATDSCGAMVSDSFILHINNVNHPPVVDAGEDLVVDEGATIKLTCSASDPDGDALSYRWSAESDRGTLDDPTLLHPVYTAPMTTACEGEEIVLTLTVTDRCGASVCDTLIVHVRNLNVPPIVEVGPGFSMKEGTARRITSVASDPECGVLSYYWTASKGTFDDPFAVSPCFTAPTTDLCEGEDVVLTLTVTDPCGASAIDSLVVHVVNVNVPPVVNADP